MTWLDELDAAAEKATPGPWESDGRLVMDCRSDAIAIVNLARTDDSDFIAACSPERIRALIAAIKAADAMYGSGRQRRGLTMRAYADKRAELAKL